jgi:hypothetical protein
MTTIQTSRDIFSTITLRPSELPNATTIRINYRIVETNIVTGRELARNDRSLTIIDRAEIITPNVDENGNPTGGNTITPATTDYTDFLTPIVTPNDLWNAMLQRAIIHANLVEWDGSIIDDIENDPAAETPVPFEDKIGQLVAPPNKLIYEGNIYAVVQLHTVSNQYIPGQPSGQTLYTFEGPVIVTPNRPAWTPQTYGIGAEVSHIGKAWKNRRPNNNQQFAPATNGSGWMEITEAGLLQGTWYNLGNEGYPTGYIALGPPCYINNNANNTFAPTGFGWTNITCP